MTPTRSHQVLKGKRLPAVSVVIPAFNPGPLLERALGSVFEQSVRDMEVIVIDDGSDEDLAWVEALDTRVRLLRQQNRGVSTTRNRGVTLSRAPWVAFLDQDDEWAPNKLELQLALLADEPKATFSSTGFLWAREDGSSTADGHAMSYGLLASTGMVCLSTAVVSRTQYLAVGGQNPLLHQAGDFDLFLKLLRNGPAAHVDQPLVRYHYHSANASRDYRSAYRERQTILRLHELECLRRGDTAGALSCRHGRRRSRSLFGAQAYDAARAAVGSSDWALFGPHLLDAVVWSPTLVGRSLIHKLSRRRMLNPR